MRGDLALTQVHLEQVDPRQVHTEDLEGVQRIAAELEGGACAAAPRLPVDELQAVVPAPVAEVGRRDDARALPRERSDVLEEDPPLDRRALDVGEERQPMEVSQAAHDALA